MSMIWVLLLSLWIGFILGCIGASAKILWDIWQMTE